MHACSDWGCDLNQILGFGFIMLHVLDSHECERLPMLQNGVGKLHIRRWPKPELLKATHGAIPLWTIANPSLHWLHSIKFQFLLTVQTVHICSYFLFLSCQYLNFGRGFPSGVRCGFVDRPCSLGVLRSPRLAFPKRIPQHEYRARWYYVYSYVLYVSWANILHLCTYDVQI